MIKLLLILLLVVIAAHVVTSLLRAGKRSQTLGNGVDRDKLNRDKAIDVEYSEIVEENGAGSG